jgi:hypothetical protein
MENNLLKLLDEVHDEHSFLKFVQALITDRADEVGKEKIKSSSPFGSGANGWENVTIENYLEAASAWASASNFGRRCALENLMTIAGVSSPTFYTRGKFTNKTI